ncbi:uncharacterized protein K02A2.6-like [Sabethes cyaneus]|uniref:uncharacterized protein K02A2.6-like n=1 Tax=Sabethes cyaneus TaxID=53552 RepID=UPI00237EA129|nr:uncharacterized protein K02A2.6-like [Sabethes cyaneus]
MKDCKIQSRLLEVRGLTLERAHEIAVSMELSVKGGQEIHSRQSRPELNLVEHPATKHAKYRAKKANTASKVMAKPDSNKKACYRCGSAEHLANKCPYIKSACDFCKMTGHIQKVCLKKKGDRKSDANQMEESDVHNTAVTTAEICGVDSAIDFKSKADKFWLKLNVNKMQVNFEIDSGSPVAIMSAAVKEKYFPSTKLLPPDLELVSYSGNSIQICGMCLVTVRYRGADYQLSLYVAENKKHPLLGRSWMKVLKTDLGKFYEDVYTISASSTTSASEAVKRLLARYDNVCDKSMGKINGLAAKLQLKPNVHPVYMKARPVPFFIRNAVESEINNLLENGVLVKVNHSAWATPVVPVMKLNNKVRLCGDYKLTVNPNIAVDDHPLPTVEELFANVAGGEKFSKIDLSQAYLQLEVDSEFQEILTLSTHMGLYRPTRLMYGVSSAPAIWVLNGIPGVTVFLDDIRITGPNDEVHLQRLEEGYN